MKDERECRMAIRDLCNQLRTNWKNYDYEEKTKEWERRVPKLDFDKVKNIEVQDENIEHVDGFMLEQFVRKYTVVYHEQKYLIAISVEAHFGGVSNFIFGVYAVTDQGLKKILSEPL